MQEAVALTFYTFYFHRVIINLKVFKIFYIQKIIAHSVHSKTKTV